MPSDYRLRLLLSLRIATLPPTFARAEDKKIRRQTLLSASSASRFVSAFPASCAARLSLPETQIWLTVSANRLIIGPMSDFCRLIWCAMVELVRSRAALQAEILILRHQLNVLRRKSPKMSCGIPGKKFCGSA